MNPGSGKGIGCRTWESVAPVFSQAKVKTKVHVFLHKLFADDLASPKRKCSHLLVFVDLFSVGYCHRKSRACF